MKSGFLRASICLAILSITGCSTPINTEQTNVIQPQVVAQDVYPMPAVGNDVVGQAYQVKAQPGDTLLKVGETYDMGAQELLAANPRLGSGKIRAGTVITIPAEFVLPPPQFRKGIVINIAEMRLYYFDNFNNTVVTFPVAVGREGWDTPLATTYVYRKQESPTWNVPKSIRDAYLEKTGTEHPLQVAPGPENPLGDYAIYLQLNGYLIHGTNAPETIGRKVSSGCIRMFNSDVAKLYSYVNRGTPVNFVYYPYKAGWINGDLDLEAHQPLGSLPADSNPNNSATATEAITMASQEHPSSSVNWSSVHQVVAIHSGIPTMIGNRMNG